MATGRGSAASTSASVREALQCHEMTSLNWCDLGHDTSTKIPDLNVQCINNVKLKSPKSQFCPAQNKPFYVPFGDYWYVLSLMLPCSLGLWHPWSLDVHLQHFSVSRGRKVTLDQHYESTLYIKKRSHSSSLTYSTHSVIAYLQAHSRTIMPSYRSTLHRHLCLPQREPAVSFWFLHLPPSQWCGIRSHIGRENHRACCLRLHSVLWLYCPGLSTSHIPGVIAILHLRIIMRSGMGYIHLHMGNI